MIEKFYQIIDIINKKIEEQINKDNPDNSNSPLEDKHDNSNPSLDSKQCNLSQSSSIPNKISNLSTDESIKGKDKNENSNHPPEENNTKDEYYNYDPFSPTSEILHSIF